MNPYILLAYILSQSCAATTVSNSWACNAGSDITTFPACDNFLNSGNSCATVLDRPGKQDCLCNQDYLDSLYGCENELRLCFLGNELDSTFDTAIESWDSLCGSFVTFTPTTASASDYTAFPDDLCNEVKKACITAKNLINECMSYVSDTDTSRFSSCTCRPQLLRQDYSCEYVLNKTCLVTDAALSNLWAYSSCDNFASVIGTGLPEVKQTAQSSLQELTYSTAQARSTTTLVPTSTSTETSTGNHLKPSILLVTVTIIFTASKSFFS